MVYYEAVELWEPRKSYFGPLAPRLYMVIVVFLHFPNLARALLGLLFLLYFEQ